MDDDPWAHLREGSAAARVVVPARAGSDRALLARVGIGEQLEAGTLQRACQWATEALAQGNVWAATSHEFFVIYERGRLQVAET